jgi:hypothetical protein
MSTVTTYAAISSYCTSAALAIGGAVDNNPIGFAGLLIALATFLVNWYYKQKSREVELEELNLKKEQNGKHPN